MERGSAKSSILKFLPGGQKFLALMYLFYWCIYKMMILPGDKDSSLHCAVSGHVLININPAWGQRFLTSRCTVSGDVIIEKWSCLGAKIPHFAALRSEWQVLQGSLGREAAAIRRNVSDEWLGWIAAASLQCPKKQPVIPMRSEGSPSPSRNLIRMRCIKIRAQPGVIHIKPLHGFLQSLVRSSVLMLSDVS